MDPLSVHTDLSEWVRQHTDALYAWALRKTGNSHLAEDLVQETFLAAAESVNNFQGKSAPLTWLTGILKNKIAGYYRQLSCKADTVQISEDKLDTFFRPSGQWMGAAIPKPWKEPQIPLLDQPEFNKIFDDCIDFLPAAMRACIQLKYLEEKKGEEICKEMDLTPTNYWQLVHRAKIQLRDCLDKHWFQTQ